MTLPPGRRIGVYEISGLIGEGGMGQVYRARDTTLHRDVALKVLPEFFVTDPERLARFRREALTLAALNHPNIAQVFGIEESGDLHALAMELADGEDLFHRLQRGAIPLDEALPLARQIAAALEAAHERGIIHRDLKPSNIKLRPDGTVKVLDFGLAKAADLAVAASRDLSQSPTITSPAMTRAGMILGTAAYMSPEQAKGRPVDKRADVWAFGCVLFEMLTGARAFPGDDLSETLASVLKGEPDFALLASRSSPACVAVVRACLQRDLNRRVRDIGDVMLALDGAFASAASMPAIAVPAPSVWARRGIPFAAASLLIVAALAGLSLMRRSATPRPERVHLALNLPASDRLIPADNLIVGAGAAGNTMTLSPDGRTLIYTAVHDGVQQLYRRSFGDAEPVAITGTAGGSVPFFSPDGRWLGFVVNRTLKKMLLPDGVPVTLQSHSLPIVDATWGDDGQIVLGTWVANDVLYSVPSDGGSIQPLTKAGHENGRVDMRPEYLPESRGVLFIRVPDAYVHVSQTGEDKLVVKDAEWARYLPTGHLLFGRRSTIFAVPFDLQQLTTVGVPVPVAGAVSGRASVGRNGTMIYQTGEALLGSTFVWVDRSGREEPLVIPQCQCGDPALSPDGRSLAVAIRSGIDRVEVYTYDLRRGGGLQQLTVNANAVHPSWTPDGRHVGFVMNRPDGQATFAWRAADGTGPIEELVKGGDPAFEGAWTPDGQTLLLVPVSPKTLGDILQVPRGGRGQPTTLLQGSAWDYAPRVSPDGRWLAYATTESGQDEIYVRPYPNVNAGSWKISVDGGWDPRWSTKGDELFYGHEGHMYRVGVEPAASFSFTAPQILFSGDLVWPIGRHAYDVAPDGRFLMMKHVRGNVSIQVVVNWLDELKERVPVRSAR